jgi:mannose-1-phosphate guanylyltransferase
MRCASFASPVIVCDERFSGQALGEAREINIMPGAIIAEPSGRGTAAAVAGAAFMLREENPLILVMPSDHVIASAVVFTDAVRRAAAMNADIVILGKKPSSPAARYGYIQTCTKNGAQVTERFIEKPPLRAARALVAEPGIFWNTGIFLCRARAMLEFLSRYAPGVYDGADKAMSTAFKDGVFLRPATALYNGIPQDSIDRAVMEKLESGAVLPLETEWHDVGCWERVFALKAAAFSAPLSTARDYESGRKLFRFSRRNS